MSSNVRSERTLPVSEYVRAFAARRQSWIALARNLVPVVGVYALDWSIGLTVFNYWLDGLAGLAAILAAVLMRGILESRRTLGTGVVRLALGGLLIWAIVFGLFAMPYWFLLDSARGVLDIGQVAAQVAESPLLWLTFGAVVIGQFWRAFDGGYVGMPEARLKVRGQADFGALIARAVVMSMLARVGLSAWLVPLMALALTWIEMWPDMQAQLLLRYRDRKPAT